MIGLQGMVDSPALMVGQTLASFVSVENAATSDLVRLSAIFHSTLQRWTMSTDASAFLSASGMVHAVAML